MRENSPELYFNDTSCSNPGKKNILLQDNKKNDYSFKISNKVNKTTVMHIWKLC